MICWWGHWCRFIDECRYHKLISFTREQASVGISLPYSVKFGKTGL
jgi:hypothetical protein